MTIENTLFSAGGGFALGVVAGMAIKRIIKLAAIILGVFILALVYLSYRGWISVNWIAVQNQTTSAAYNATQQAGHMINQTITQLTTHPSTLQAQSLTISAGIAFVPGFLVGLRH